MTIHPRQITRNRRSLYVLVHRSKEFTRKINGASFKNGVSEPMVCSKAAGMAAALGAQMRYGYSTTEPYVFGDPTPEERVEALRAGGYVPTLNDRFELVLARAARAWKEPVSEAELRREFAALENDQAREEALADFEEHILEVERLTNEQRAMLDELAAQERIADEPPETKFLMCPTCGLDHPDSGEQVMKCARGHTWLVQGRDPFIDAPAAPQSVLVEETEVFAITPPGNDTDQMRAFLESKAGEAGRTVVRWEPSFDQYGSSLSRLHVKVERASLDVLEGIAAEQAERGRELAAEDALEPDVTFVPEVLVPTAEDPLRFKRSFFEDQARFKNKGALEDWARETLGLNLNQNDSRKRMIDELFADDRVLEIEED